MKVETKPSTQMLLCVLVFLLGGGLLVYSIKYTKDYNYKQSTYKDVSGIVTRADTKEENGTETTDITVKYEVDGKVYHAYTTLSSYEVYVEGSTINFKYNPDKELYYSSENYQDNNYNIQYNVNKGIITILNNNNNNTVKIWQYSLKDKAFIIYMKIIKNEIISNYDESQIKNLSKEEYNNNFRTILNYLDNIIK